MKEQKKSSFYVGIKNPRELRRNTLEASKSVIAAIQKQQRILDIQKEKNILKKKLKDDIAELKMLFSKFEKILPPNIFETSESSEKTALKEQVKTPSSQTKQVLKMDYKESEVDKLHKHLNMIEERLKNLK